MGRSTGRPAAISLQGDSKALPCCLPRLPWATVTGSRGLTSAVPTHLQRLSHTLGLGQ